jgi:hypothetical protein
MNINSIKPSLLTLDQGKVLFFAEKIQQAELLSLGYIVHATRKVKQVKQKKETKQLDILFNQLKNLPQEEIAKLLGL